MASFTVLCICVIDLMISVCLGLQAAETICINDWDVSIEGANPSQLRIHHMSYTSPGEQSGMQWDWSWLRKLGGTFWINQDISSGIFNGGFTVQPKSVFHFPASFTWRLKNGTLYLTTRGPHKELAPFPAWRLSICYNQLVWGVSSEKDLYVQYGDINETRSLDESWTEEIRFKRQAEFPTVPQQPNNRQPNSTLARWWQSFLQSIGVNNQGNGRSNWIETLADMIINIIFKRSPQNPSYPRNPDAETIPGQTRDVEDMLGRSPNSRNPRKVYNLHA